MTPAEPGLDPEPGPDAEQPASSEPAPVQDVPVEQAPAQDLSAQDATDPVGAGATEAELAADLPADATADPAEAQPEAEPEAQPEADVDTEEPESDLPPLADDTELANALEALLLVVDSPVTEETLALALDQQVARVTGAVRALSAQLTERGSGIDLRRVGDGWRLVTRDRFAPFVEKLLLDGQRAKLTRAALETLAVIAYRQPVTRARVAAVRGVNVDGVIRTLVARGLIQEVGTDAETGGILYRTTELFLERLGLSSLTDLPAIAPLLPEVDAIDDV
ncbi:MAG TPA: SMC-Scp complex subunit ScpB [Pseudonocardiaceae bacterium]|nr:SMC-Scp complex subunit ScpB [Pseudonocardiaceae bacterium]